MNFETDNKIPLHQEAIWEMAFERKEIMAEAKGQFWSIFKHWILVKYSAMYDNENYNFGHWQEELVVAMWNVGMMNLKKNNSRETVKKAINEMYFTKMQVQNMSLSKQIDSICKKEHINLDTNVFEQMFKEALPFIVLAIASGDYDKICQYVMEIE